MLLSRPWSQGLPPVEGSHLLPRLQPVGVLRHRMPKLLSFPHRFRQLLRRPPCGRERHPLSVHSPEPWLQQRRPQLECRRRAIRWPLGARRLLSRPPSHGRPPVRGSHLLPRLQPATQLRQQMLPAPKRQPPSQRYGQLVRPKPQVLARPQPAMMPVKRPFGVVATICVAPGANVHSAPSSGLSGCQGWRTTQPARAILHWRVGELRGAGASGHDGTRSRRRRANMPRCTKFHTRPTPAAHDAQVLEHVLPPIRLQSVQVGARFGIHGPTREATAEREASLG